MVPAARTTNLDKFEFVGKVAGAWLQVMVVFSFELFKGLVAGTSHRD